MKTSNNPQNNKENTKSIRYALYFSDLLLIAAIVFGSPAGINILYPGISDAAASFAWIVSWGVSAVIAVFGLIASILIRHQAKQVFNREEREWLSLSNTLNLVLFCICIIPMLVLVAWIPLALIFIVGKIATHYTLKSKI